MYVLHHADKPQIYAGSAGRPADQPDCARLWKGVTEAAGLAAMAFAAVVGVHALHRRRPERGAAGGRGRRQATDWDASMSAYDIEPGDEPSGRPVTVDRYTAGARINHWITAGVPRAAGAVRPGDVPPGAVLAD